MYTSSEIKKILVSLEADKCGIASGVVTGILGIISVVGPFFIAALGITVIITSVLTTVWVLLVGYKLLKLSQLSTISDK
jgi:hypothetical protein